MASDESFITLTGNLVADPKLTFTDGGTPVARFRIAQTSRYRDNASGEWRDGSKLFLTCEVWRLQATNVAESLTRGTRVIVYGKLVQRTYDGPNGGRQTVDEVDVQDVAPSLKHASAKVTKTPRGNGAAADTQPYGR